MLAFTHLVDLQPDFLSYYNHWHYRASSNTFVGCGRDAEIFSN